jgi:hypothetical protein
VVGENKEKFKNVTTYELNTKDVPVKPLSKLSKKVGWYRVKTLLMYGAFFVWGNDYGAIYK